VGYSKLDWLKLVIINGVKKTRIEHNGVYPSPDVPSTYIHGEKREPSKQGKIEKWEDGESSVC
jgi:hypothetical protein